MLKCSFLMHQPFFLREGHSFLLVSFIICPNQAPVPVQLIFTRKYRLDLRRCSETQESCSCFKTEIPFPDGIKTHRTAIFLDFPHRESVPLASHV